jgi:tetratricopeptide (TPR) repeat protein
MSARLEGLPPAARQHVILAGEALESGRVDEAERHLAPASSSYPLHPEVLRMQAGVQGLRGRHQQAVSAMRSALQQRPHDALYHNTLGALLGGSGDFDGAIAALRRCCELQPSLALAWFNLGLMLVRCVRNDEALLALKQAVALAPDHMAARALLGDMQRTQGNIEEATAEYRRVLSERPWSGMAWWGLADIKTKPLTDKDIQALQAAMQQPRASDEDLIAMGFALAKALDDAGRYADSLAALSHANNIARGRQRWNAAGFSSGISEINRAFATPAVPDDSTLGKEVVFIISMPRSGSTLVEQILASHSRVEGAGELPDLPLVLAEESHRRNAPFPSWVPLMKSEDWKRLGERYLERTAHWRREKSIFTDKLPGNWIYAGAIRAMLPGARIISCRRDPLETCFSCYRQHLANNEYSRTFDDLARFWRDFNKSTQQALALHPQHILDHSYEELVADPEAGIRRLLDFCGLPFETSCLAFHRTQREVRSPSSTQVRQPLQKGTARAGRYGALLDPLKHALQMTSKL